MTTIRNFFKTCLCGYDLRFDFLEQHRTCPGCGRENHLSPGTQAYLRNDLAKIKHGSTHTA
jgi:hypothetical protein